MQLKLHHLLFDTVTISFRSRGEMRGVGWDEKGDGTSVGSEAAA